MNTASDCRAPGATRIPFEGMVEIGGALGPSFEAQAINLSEEGMHLRTAYVPEVGQPVTCRFEAGTNLSVVAAGEVLWREDAGDGGEFGIRFTNLDAESSVALQRIMGMAEDGVLPKPAQGRKVRLHIEGLASPMRARVKGTQATCVTAYSDLGFLEVGKSLDLEDAMSGNRRPASIERVDVELEKGARIPQLVVTLRYDDEEARRAAGGSLGGMAYAEKTDGEQSTAAEDHPIPDADLDEADEAPAHAESAEVDEEIDEEAADMKGGFARTAAKITPAMAHWATRAKTTIALLAAKAAERRARARDEAEAPVRRTTAPAPGGGLHTAGRKVFRGEIADDRTPEAPKARFKVTKRKAAIVGAAGIATILAIVALRKPAPAPQIASAPPPEPPAAAAPVTTQAPTPPPMDPLAAAAQWQAMSGGPNAMMSTGKTRTGKPAPFTNGAVGGHGNVIRMKMDGVIEAIQGASQPTGFTVVIPNRKSMDAAGPLASKDARIAALRVANEPQGAELTVTFKDGVPNYVVRARGDVLELVLAKPNAEAHAHRKSKKR